MLDKAFKCLLKASLKIKLSKCSFFKEQIHCLGHLVSITSILALAIKIQALMKLQPPTNTKEVRHFLGLTWYYWKFICNYRDIVHPLNCLMCKSHPYNWTPEWQASLTCCTPNSLIHQYCSYPRQTSNTYYSQTWANFVTQVFTQASTEDSNESLLIILTSEDPLKSVESQTQDLWLDSNVIHPVAYISGSFSQSQCRWPVITKECFSVFMSIKNVPFTYKMPTY